MKNKTYPYVFTPVTVRYTPKCGDRISSTCQCQCILHTYRYYTRSKFRPYLSRIRRAHRESSVAEMLQCWRLGKIPVEISCSLASCRVCRNASKRIKWGKLSFLSSLSVRTLKGLRCYRPHWKWDFFILHSIVPSPEPRRVKDWNSTCRYLSWVIVSKI